MYGSPSVHVCSGTTRTFIFTGTNATGVTDGAGSTDLGGNTKFNFFLDVVKLRTTKPAVLLLCRLPPNNDIHRIPLTQQEAYITHLRRVTEMQQNATL
jgi:hypothetical protein